MFLFLKLVLAHLIADYVLQFEELYRLKVRSFLGQLFHVLIHGIVVAALLFPFLNEWWILVFIAVLMTEHLIQDIIKYRATKISPQKTFIYYMEDQVLHLVILSLIFLLPVANEVRGIPGHHFLSEIYKDNKVTLFFIFFIMLTFAGNYTLNSFYKSYIKNAGPLRWITAPEITLAMVERSVIAGAVLFAPHPYWIGLSLLVGLLRLLFARLRKSSDFLVSAGYTIILSLVFKYFL